MVITFRIVFFFLFVLVIFFSINFTPFPLRLKSWIRLKLMCRPKNYMCLIKKNYCEKTDYVTFLFLLVFVLFMVRSFFFLGGWAAQLTPLTPPKVSSLLSLTCIMPKVCFFAPPTIEKNKTHSTCTLATTNYHWKIKSSTH